MTSAEQYRAKAKDALRMAAETTDELAVTLWRVLADDYLQLANEAGNPVVQQQQQPQPKNDEGPPQSD